MSLCQVHYMNIVSASACPVFTDLSGARTCCNADMSLCQVYYMDLSLSLHPVLYSLTCPEPGHAADVLWQVYYRDIDSVSVPVLYSLTCPEPGHAAML
jgi:hypothetical protein